MTKIAIIGGGSAGLMAACAAGRACRENRDVSITIFEAADRVGKKLLKTGNGRCNLTNMGLVGADCEFVKRKYFGEPEFVASALKVFGVPETLEFFEKLGLVTTVEDGGRVYPRCGQAAAVLDVLRNELGRIGVEVVAGVGVKAVRGVRGGFVLEGDCERQFDKVIVATGGGADGLGVLRKLGHTVKQVYPALVPVKTDFRYSKTLMGIRVNAEASLWCGGEEVAAECGEVLFTEYGLSGIPVLDLSGRVAAMGADARTSAAPSSGLQVVLDLMPEMTESELAAVLTARRDGLAELDVAEFFTGMFNRRVGNVLFELAGVSRGDELTEAELLRLAKAVKHVRMNCTGTTGFPNAQVTGGGLACGEFDVNTMESTKFAGLYTCGEVFDVYGACGGFNLQWAWTSGWLAGTAAAGVLTSYADKV